MKRIPILLMLGLAVPALGADDPIALTPLEFESGPSQDLGVAGVGETVVRRLRVQNRGRRPLVVEGLRVKAPFAAEGCRQRLEPGQACELLLRFTPRAPGRYAEVASLPVESEYRERSVALRLTGRGLAPAQLLVEGEGDFGPLVAGRSSEKTFEVRNEGEVAARSLRWETEGPFRVDGGNCRDRLEPRKSCSVQVRFTPPKAGAHDGRLRAVYGDGPGNAVREVALGGFALEPAQLHFQLPPGGDFGRKLLGTATELVVAVSNTGDVAATGLAFGALQPPFSFQGGKYPGTQGTCRGELAPRTSCRLVLQFAPLLSGQSIQELVLRYQDGASPRALSGSLRAEGITPARLAAREVSPVEIPPVLVTRSQRQIFHLTNDGQADAERIQLLPEEFRGIFSLVKPEGDERTCGERLANREVCVMAVDFSPKERGARDAAVTVRYHNGVSEQKLRLSFRGTGLAPARIALDQAPKVDFGTVLTETEKRFFLSLENKGDVEATGLQMPGLPAPFSIAGRQEGGPQRNVCGSAMLPGLRCVLPLAFKPEKTGRQEGRLVLSYRDGLGEQSLPVALGGTGIGPAKLAFADPKAGELGLQLVGGTRERAVVIRNTGETKAELRRVGLDRDVADFTVKPAGEGTRDCDDFLAPGAQCTVDLVYTPRRTASFESRLKIAYDDGRGPDVFLELPVSGESREPARLVWEETPEPFGAVLLGRSVERTFRLRNEGESPAVKPAPALAAGGKGAFALKGTDCGEALAPRSRCRITVAFTPAKGEPHGDKLVVKYEDGLQAKTLEQALTGTGLRPGVLELAQPAVDFGPQVAGTRSSRPVEIRNGGDAPLTLKEGRFEAPPGYRVEDGDCPEVLPPRGGCRLALTFAPDKEAPFGGEAKLVYDDGVASDRRTGLAVKGLGRAPASVVVEPAQPPEILDAFVGEKRTFEVKLVNRGGVEAALEITALDGPFHLEPGSCAQKLPPGKECRLTVRFEPPKDKSYGDSFEVRYFDGIRKREREVKLKGTARFPAKLVPSDERLDLGRLTVGEVAREEVRIENEGGVDATGVTIQSARITGLQVEPGDCPPVLAPGKRCRLSVVYQPVSGGTLDHKVEIRYRDGRENRSLTLAITGSSKSAVVPEREVTGK